MRVLFDEPKVGRRLRARRQPPSPPQKLRGIETSSSAIDRVTLDPPLLTALMSTAREKRRQVPLASIPPRMVQAVLAIEDRRFYEHPGIDPIRMAGALLTNLRGEKRYLVGGSTITQQLARNFFLTEGAGSGAGERAAIDAPQAAENNSWRSCSSARRRRTRFSSCT